MKRLLLAVDRNEDRAVAQAETVIDLFDAGEAIVHLLHVFGDEPNPRGLGVHQLSAVRKAVDRLEAAGIEVELEEESGDPTTAIVELGEERDVDLICIAGRKRSPAGKLVFGSVSQEVLLTTERPVLTCPVKSHDDGD